MKLEEALQVASVAFFFINQQSAQTYHWPGGGGPSIIPGMLELFYHAM